MTIYGGLTFACKLTNILFILNIQLNFPIYLSCKQPLQISSHSKQNKTTLKWHKTLWESKLVNRCEKLLIKAQPTTHAKSQNKRLKAQHTKQMNIQKKAYALLFLYIKASGSHRNPLHFEGFSLDSTLAKTCRTKLQTFLSLISPQCIWPSYLALLLPFHSFWLPTRRGHVQSPPRSTRSGHSTFSKRTSIHYSKTRQRSVYCLLFNSTKHLSSADFN